MSTTLPAGSTLGKSFEYGIDINKGTYASPVWQPVRRISGWAPTFPKTLTDVATYDDLGAPNQEVSGVGFAASFTVQMNRDVADGAPLPEVKLLRDADRTTGSGAVLDIRFYHKPEVGAPDPDDAGRVFVTVDVSRTNTGNAETDGLSVTLTGKGKYTPIVNPWPGAAAGVPVITLVSPESAAAGALVHIHGDEFLGATAVKFGTTSSPDFQIASNLDIYALVPTGTAGAANVTVVTPAGTSAAVSFTRL